ncbi:MAG: rRNA maturation RNase YbeY [Chitinophagaceae bacterium]|jgi:rRNA maturation RNase YbeY|nr:rRNA maturation RNase YbeY [Chitinophagaceae bacterium]MCA6488349.1 rRNA maturation RNase YbeY [Chitinophagaceae bacterium]MCA6499636.1 rRNA maturation RNase YbeY [Chitinophagaceae bacterium]MCA6516463.1 rRNA maturation RNase YbeY [Chitinophagaceae bacterium]MCE2973279.1 rRNA maturation RNase YbeY [Sediminibacterium sp.]
MSLVFFHTADLNYRLQNKTALKKLLADLFQKEGKRLEGLSIVFCSDDYLLSMNRQFLQHDYYTDILTFDVSERGGPVSGELYISVDRVRDNAHGLGVSAVEEMQRVIIHGSLHLCGYKDKLKKQQLLMRQKEERYLRLLHKRLANG